MFFFKSREWINSPRRNVEKIDEGDFRFGKKTRGRERRS